MLLSLILFKKCAFVGLDNKLYKMQSTYIETESKILTVFKCVYGGGSHDNTLSVGGRYNK